MVSFITVLARSCLKKPEYAQLYIFDTENELRNRVQVCCFPNSTFRPNEEIVAALIQMFNVSIQLFSYLEQLVIGFLKMGMIDIA